MTFLIPYYNIPPGSEVVSLFLSSCGPYFVISLKKTASATCPRPSLLLEARPREDKQTGHLQLPWHGSRMLFRRSWIPPGDPSLSPWSSWPETHWACAPVTGWRPGGRASMVWPDLGKVPSPHLLLHIHGVINKGEKNFLRKRF